MTFEHKVTVNLLPNVTDRDAIARISNWAESRRETMAWSLDDAKYLVKNGKPGSVLRIWNANYLSEPELFGLRFDTDLNIQYWNLPELIPYMQFIADQLFRGSLYSTREMEDIFAITIHHTVNWNYGLSTFGNAKTIASYHVNTKGWPGIGYHYLIGPDGEILNVNSLRTISYHTGTKAAPGDENKMSIGVALGGDFRKTSPTRVQKYAAFALVEHIRHHQVSNSLAILPHKRMPGAATVCPGVNNLEQWLKIVSGESKWI